MSLGNLFRDCMHRGYGKPKKKKAGASRSKIGKRASMYSTMQLTAWGSKNLQWYLSRLQKGEDQYREVEQDTGVPWQVVAVIHCLECGGSFLKHLHNGDPLSDKTVRVPKGRPKTDAWTWRSSAADAVRYDKLDRVDWESTEAGLKAIEYYNGRGYEMRGMVSPYLFSGSQYYSQGKFVRDGVFDPKAVSKQMGAAVLLSALGWHKEGHIA